VGFPMSSEAIAIHCRDVGKAYRLYRRPSDRLREFFWPWGHSLGKTFHALEGINFEMRKGEVLGVIGLNGAGKSTLLQLITGTLEPSSGTIATHGRVAAILELGSGFNPDFSGRENIYLNAATLGLSRAEIESRLKEIVAFADIGEHIDHPVKTYSSGMLIRLAFSIATSVDPDILIIDEALSVGDGAFGKKSFDRIMRIKERGATILFCSHVLFHIDTFCDRVLWLDRGRQRALGDGRRVLLDYKAFLEDHSQHTHRNNPQASLTLQRSHTFFETVEVDIDDHLGDALQGISRQSGLTVKMSFSSDPTLPCPSLAVVISDERGRIVGSASSLTVGLTATRDSSGRGRVYFSLPRLMLNRGHYLLGVYLFCERGLHGYDMRDPVARFSMSNDGIEQGDWLIEGDWGHA